MTRGGLFAGTKCPYSASRVKSWTYLWVADAKPSATQYHPGGVVLITQPPRWLTTGLFCSYFGRESTQSQSSKGARAHVMRSGASLRGVQARGIIIRARGGRWGSALRPALAEGTKMRETSPLGAFSKTPAKRPSKDSRGSYAETQYSALGLPSVFLGFVIRHRCQVIGNSEATRWTHVV